MALVGGVRAGGWRLAGEWQARIGRGLACRSWHRGTEGLCCSSAPGPPVAQLRYRDDWFFVWGGGGRRTANSRNTQLIRLQHLGVWRLWDCNVAANKLLFLQPLLPSCPSGRPWVPPSLCGMAMRKAGGAHGTKLVSAAPCPQRTCDRGCRDEGADILEGCCCCRRQAHRPNCTRQLHGRGGPRPQQCATQWCVPRRCRTLQCMPQQEAKRLTAFNPMDTLGAGRRPT